MASLIVQTGTRPLRYELVGDNVTIGRAPSNDIVIENPVVSAQHAVLLKFGNCYWLKDLNSTNGTYVNGVHFTYGELKDGDAIRFGAVTATFAERCRKWWATCPIRTLWACSTRGKSGAAIRGDTKKIEPDDKVKIGRFDQLNLQNAMTRELAIEEELKEHSARKAMAERLLAYLDRQIDISGQTTSQSALKFWRTRIRNLKQR
jgi:pSer/pThr/pTyr-binding forkhead associated (FHA) protein